MNDFLFFILDDGSIKRINIAPVTLQIIVNLFVAHLPKFLDDNITPILFDGQFKPSEDEVLYAVLTLPENFSKIPDNTIEYDDAQLPEDKVKTLALYHDGTYYFQCFSKHFVLKQKNVVLFWKGDSYEQFVDTSAFK